MAVTQTVHHHRSTTKASNKPYKSRHASKGSVKDKEKGAPVVPYVPIITEEFDCLTVYTGKVERGARKTPHQQLMTKLDRRNQSRQKQQLKFKEKAQTTGIFNGQNGAPRQVAVVPLSVDIDVAAALRMLNESVDVSGPDVSGDGLSRVRIDRFRQSLEYIPAKYDVVNALDVSRMGDFVVLVLSAEIEVEEQGELILRAIEGQGISNVMAVVQVCGLALMISLLGIYANSIVK